MVRSRGRRRSAGRNGRRSRDRRLNSNFNNFNNCAIKLRPSRSVDRNLARRLSRSGDHSLARRPSRSVDRNLVQRPNRGRPIVVPGRSQGPSLALRVPAGGPAVRRKAATPDEETKVDEIEVVIVTNNKRR